MFTGIITDVGEVAEVSGRGDLRARLITAFPAGGIALGASIACAGVCLTVVDRGSGDAPGIAGDWFDVDISAETLSKTTLGAWTPGTRVNLERALRVGEELGGHIVSGHVDGTAEVLSAEDSGDSTVMTFEAPAHLARFIAPKGSVALDGTSLTVNDVDGPRFTVNFIPHTKAHTTWGAVRPGARVNLEVDTMARYVARLDDMRSSGA
ncbi:riboflavin synthase [Rhodobacteraceae bacterium 2CG4]|uniref:Riboflavin synthase n=1 Tax=Halovulum marinum TaxID=2662447 RepID=A0A6L5YW63_9RHOB|nr:riboflavin synthase [Halovulum marinum]MSU88102.1 riboflavin synthase [Halovulum marinum]